MPALSSPGKKQTKSATSKKKVGEEERWEIFLSLTRTASRPSLKQTRREGKRGLGRGAQTCYVLEPDKTTMCFREGRKGGGSPGWRNRAEEGGTLEGRCYLKRLLSGGAWPGLEGGDPAGMIAGKKGSLKAESRATDSVRGS